MKIDSLLIATANTGKFNEIKEELSDLGINLFYLRDFPEYPECKEDGDSFEANAIKKARFYARHFGMFALADDSGLEVDYLGGRPGVMSARYAGEKCSDEENNQKLLQELSGVRREDRTARFRAVMSLSSPSGEIIGLAEGVIEGLILESPRGDGGFGYDPLFYVPELGKTTAELSRSEKNRISHRGQATRKIKEILKKLLRDC